MYVDSLKFLTEFIFVTGSLGLISKPLGLSCGRSEMLMNGEWGREEERYPKEKHIGDSMRAKQAPRPLYRPRPEGPSIWSG